MARKRTTTSRGRWATLPDAELLDWRLCDLGLAIEGSELEGRVERLHEELARRGLRFKPYVWLSTDWFTPDGATGFAIPFYLAHERLVRLERSQMLQVEGGSQDECLRILRHEAAHAIDNAYHLRRRRSWRETFGRPGDAYESSYTPDPTSRAHVLNLDYWYSQSHPLEDWAETFAVWLGSGSRWRTRYADWPALAKLEYVDVLMAEIADKPPALRTRAREDNVASVRTTLREYYAQKREFYAQEGTPAFAGQLERVFPALDKGPRASTFLRRNRRNLVRRVAAATGQHRYLLDHALREMIERSHLRELRLPSTEADALVDAAVVLTSLSSQFLYGAHPRYQR
ncbi:hypothetical protein [Engelhardtia mirabilis]|uniref:Uncharacterized protein n=1 Tax=Engelhardtia mirabilis TaxID=2528011 RepID=A0A518BEG5_9BACT|nr:hypothetical protein Pla133_04460 [Planctomycetes bacterium Pla133]QDU99707.1 hypothetical protein Pla86_04460 [Planctomycetes bacterium Pla86]